MPQLRAHHTKGRLHDAQVPVGRHQRNLGAGPVFSKERDNVERLQRRPQGFVAGFSERREKEHGSVGGALLDRPFVLVKVNRLSTLPTNGFAAPPHMLQQQRVQQPSHPIGKVPAKFRGYTIDARCFGPLGSRQHALKFCKRGHHKGILRVCPRCVGSWRPVRPEALRKVGERNSTAPFEIAEMLPPAGVHGSRSGAGRSLSVKDDW